MDNTRKYNEMVKHYKALMESCCDDAIRICTEDNRYKLDLWAYHYNQCANYEFTFSEFVRYGFVPKEYGVKISKAFLKYKKIFKSIKPKD